MKKQKQMTYEEAKEKVVTEIHCACERVFGPLIEENLVKNDLKYITTQVIDEAVKYLEFGWHEWFLPLKKLK